MKRIMVPALLMLLAACGSNEIGHLKDVNQQEVNQGYNIWYDQQEGETKVTAYFRFAGPAGTTLVLDAPGKIEMDREALEKNETAMSGCYYEKTFSGPMPEKEYLLEFTDYNGKKYTNKVKWNHMVLQTVPSAIHKSENLVLNFEGSPEGRKEEIVVEISDSANTVTESFDHTRIGGRIIFPRQKLQTLNGQVTVNIRRNGVFELKQQAHAGGYINTGYVLKPFTATMVD